MSIFFQDGTADPQQSSTAHSPPTSSNHTLSTYDDIMNTLRLLEAVPPSLEPGQQVPPSSGHGKQGTLSEGKLQSILSYLDQVEQAELDRSNLLAKSVSRGKGSSLVQEPSSAAVLALQRKYVFLGLGGTCNSDLSVYLGHPCYATQLREVPYSWETR